MQHLIIEEKGKTLQPHLKNVENPKELSLPYRGRDRERKQ